MTKEILRSAIAAVIGIAVAFGLIWLAQYAGNEISPAEYDLDTGEILIPIGSTIALIVGWFIGTFAGAWLAIRISAGTGAGWIVAGSVIGAALYRAVTLADTWWIMALGVAVPLAAVWLAQRAATIIAD
ncbi:MULTISPECIES: hypothetical protein [unclassified Sphingopyxis]|jgi:hypothetical protein|uniref:hypothetical protein n=1 Tax=unclassified Sphingopyxis TaxID=2614943 RepID=UPI0028594C70|nr:MULTISPECIES: hypothetical protein [unclassified Sphingopyxis]MDR6832011.1 hypothetical protein [Sphingopyxis sp. BE122]MDR7227753.1 hypothetical protein [Sphingopyxis sp. BE259]